MVMTKGGRTGQNVTQRIKCTYLISSTVVPQPPGGPAPAQPTRSQVHTISHRSPQRVSPSPVAILTSWLSAHDDGGCCPCVRRRLGQPSSCQECWSRSEHRPQPSLLLRMTASLPSDAPWSAGGTGIAPLGVEYLQRHGRRNVNGVLIQFARSNTVQRHQSEILELRLDSKVLNSTIPQNSDVRD